MLPKWWVFQYGVGWDGHDNWFALGFVEALECGRMRVMTKEITPKDPTSCRYTKQEIEPHNL
jgi:hypothetical protein